MFKIVERRALNPTVTKLVIHAPLIAKKAQPGQFIIVRPFEDSERIPLTVADYDRENGTITIIFQVVGGTTMELNSLKEGESVHDFVGPLGTASKLDGLKHVAVVGGGVGCAIAYPVLKKFHDDGAEVHAIVGFRSEDLVILEEDFKKSSDKLIVCTDDGSYGRKGLVTEALKELIDAGNQYDEVFAIGPMVMMKFVSKTTEPYGIPTTVSMSPIMIDGTGMWTAPTLTVTRWTGIWQSSGTRCIRTSRPTSTRRPATCSRRRPNNHGQYVFEEESHALSGPQRPEQEL